MPTLRDLQDAVTSSVLAGDSGPLAALVREDGLAFDKRLQIYRNNTFISLTEALKATYPVVCALVDERFFGYAARAFVRARPPAAPRLSEYGADLADFLARFEPARHLVYLPDVARLEWAINEAYHAPDATAIAARQLSAVAPDDYAALSFILHPSCRLVRSEYPIDRIWRAHQSGGNPGEKIDLAAGGCRLLIDRGEDGVRLTELDAAGFAFLAALRDARTLQLAYEAAAAIDGGFDLVQALSRHLGRGTFSGFTQPRK